MATTLLGILSVVSNFVMSSRGLKSWLKIDENGGFCYAFLGICVRLLLIASVVGLVIWPFLTPRREIAVFGTIGDICDSRDFRFASRLFVRPEKTTSNPFIRDDHDDDGRGEMRVWPCKRKDRHSTALGCVKNFLLVEDNYPASPLPPALSDQDVLLINPGVEGYSRFNRVLREQCGEF